MNQTNIIQDLHQMLLSSTSPFHCILESEKKLRKEGFEPLVLDAPWTVLPGRSYYVNIYGSTLAAFSIGEELDEIPFLRMAAAHTDWPCLKVKPSPEVAAGRYGKLNVEVYGGPILNTWLDRPLSMAGKICVRGENPFSPSIRYVDFKRPLLTIPNLAIHMNREVNSGTALNAQTDMLPILTMITSELDKDNYFLNLLSKEIQVSPEDILDYEMCIYNTDEGTLLGLDSEFYSAPRLDNITSVQACLKGIIESRPGKGINVAALYDNEEVGSRTKQGASSTLMEHLLEKLYLSLGFTRETLLSSLWGGYLLSLDVAHAFHPNHPEKCDIKNQVHLNDGFCLKLAANQSYATDSAAVGVIEAICREHGIPYRKFSNRSDIRGGSTLGSISSACLGIRTIDAGVPILAMHSARELMGVRDQQAIEDVARCFFNA